MSPSPWLAALAVLAAVGACSTGGGSGGSSADSAAPPAVILQPGTVSGREERAASQLLDQARAAVEAGELQAAREAAQQVVERYAATRSSGDAAWLLAQVLSQLGENLEAEAQAASYAAAMAPDDQRLVDVRLFQAERLEADDDGEGALDRLLLLPSPLPETVAANVEERVRGLAAELSGEALSRVLKAAPDQPLAALVMVAYARTLLLAGERDEAIRYAQAALASGVSGADEEAARALEAGRLPAGEIASVRLGAVLPLGGSPSLRRFGRGVEEGIEAALAAEDAPTYQVELLLRDDRGDPAMAASLVRAMEQEGAVGILGPLQDGALDEAAGARRRGIPMLSPTAVQLPGGALAVYSLGSPDPTGPRSLARYAVSSGLSPVVILHSTAPASESEANLFADVFTELGGSVLRRLSYAPRTASFRTQLQTVGSLRPRALVLPVPAEDIPLLAPQLTFYGLDSLQIRMLGTAGWTDPAVLRDVSRRHTDGVVVATPDEPGQDPPGRADFVAAYESHFRRSLTDPVPALGWDAASLFLQALRGGARTPAQVARALAGVRDFPGATGVLSVQDGRIVREHYLVCLQEGRPLPLVEGVSGVVPPRPDSIVVPGAGSPCPGSPPATRSAPGGGVPGSARRPGPPVARLH